MKKLIVLYVAMCTISCSPSADDKEELMRLHEIQREAHFSGKAQMMVDLLPIILFPLTTAEQTRFYPAKKTGEDFSNTLTL